MAIELYTNASLHLTTAPQVAYTCPIGKVAVVHSVFCSNLVANSITVDIVARNGGDDSYLGKDLPIPTGVSLSWDKPINLSAGQQIVALASESTASDLFLSILELEFN